MIKFIFFGITILLIVGFIGGYVFSNKNQSIETPSSKEISNGSLNEHSTIDSCWTILGGAVYDATDTIKKYPILQEKASLLCGKDGSAILTIQKFVSNQIDNETITKINEELKKNVIGILVP